MISLDAPTLGICTLLAGATLGLVLVLMQRRLTSVRRVNADLQKEVDERTRAESAREELLRFEQLVSRVTADLAHASGKELQHRINDALREICMFLNVQRGTLMPFTADDKPRDFSYHWVEDGYPDDEALQERNVEEHFALLVRYAREQRPLVIRRAEQFPNGSLERDYCGHYGIKSIVSVHVAGPKPLGFLVFGALKDYRDWQDELVRRLEFLGGIFGNALLRVMAESRLQTSQAEARDYLQQLTRVNRADGIGEMATSIAHEVKQPLFAIVSNAQTARRLLAREDQDTEEICDALDDIVNDGNRAASVIDNVRLMVRKEQHPTEQLDLNQVATSVIRLVEPEFQERGLVVRNELAAELPPVQGNSIELQQVIINLLVNGMQAMDDSKQGSHELVLATSAMDGFVELAVSDDGIGIDELTADRFFEPFFTTKPHGIGMGLAINRTIIEAHGGRIWATPNEGRGATFRFNLPTSKRD